MLPGLAAEFSGTRDGVKDPEALPCSHVEAANVALLVPHALRRVALRMRGPDDDHVAGDDRRGVIPDVAGHQIHLLIIVLLQIDDTVVAEARDPDAGLRVEGHEPVAGRDVQDSCVPAIGPVRQSPAESFRGATSRGGLRSRCASTASHRSWHRAPRRRASRRRSCRARR